MSRYSKLQEDIGHLPQIRTNKHFRIKSASKEKLPLGAQILTSKAKRKSSIEQTNRVFSEINKKSSSIETSIKIRITRDELKKKYHAGGDKNKIIYQGVKTQQQNDHSSIKFINHIHTINQEQNIITLQKIAKICDPHLIFSKEKLDQMNKLTQPNRFKKDKLQKQAKGKYKCRVNQYIFDHSRKKSNLCKDQETIEEFWKNVNESLILGGNQQEQVSKDLRQFVQNFTTQ